MQTLPIEVEDYKTVIDEAQGEKSQEQELASKDELIVENMEMEMEQLEYNEDTELMLKATEMTPQASPAPIVEQVQVNKGILFSLRII